jgi:hypothetical protein
MESLRYIKFKLINQRTKQVGISISFLVQVRLMLDFKYREYISNGHKVGVNSSFPEYVYWWLDTYSLHSKTFKVTESEAIGYYDHTQHCQ